MTQIALKKKMISCMKGKLCRIWKGRWVMVQKACLHWSLHLKKKKKMVPWKPWSGVSFCHFIWVITAIKSKLSVVELKQNHLKILAENKCVHLCLHLISVPPVYHHYHPFPRQNVSPCFPKGGSGGLENKNEQKIVSTVTVSLLC